MEQVRPDEGFAEVCEVVEVEDDVSEEDLEPKIDLDLGTRSDPVLDFGDVSSRSLHVFEDYQGDTFEKVGEIGIDEGPQTPSEPVPLASLVKPEPGKEQEKRGSKPPGGALSCPLFANF